MYLASTHYYSGRSAFKLMRQKVLHFIFIYLPSPKPAKDQLKKIQSMHNSQVGRGAIVLGNGPSLNKLEIQNISNEVDIFAVNQYYALDIAKVLIPKFYVLSDPLSFSESLEGLVLEPLLYDYLVSNKCVLILPHTVILSDRIPLKEVIYFDDRERFIFNTNIAPTKPRSYISVTSYKALACAIHFGYEQIDVIGFDNTEFYSYLGTNTNSIVHTGKSYATRNPNNLDGVGLEMDMLVSGMAGRMQSYAHLFGDLVKFSSFNITNLDTESLTDAFPKRCDYDI